MNIYFTTIKITQRKQRLVLLVLRGCASVGNPYMLLQSLVALYLFETFRYI